VALTEDAPNLEKSLMLRPFPQEPPSGIEDSVFKQRYREGMVQQSGVCVVVAGEKDIDGPTGTERIIADRVVDEAEAARHSSRPVISVGAAAIWKQQEAEFDRHWPGRLRNAFDVLGSGTSTADELVAAIGQFLDHLDGLAPRGGSPKGGHGAGHV